jgi:hypothetical protein
VNRPVFSIAGRNDYQPASGGYRTQESIAKTEGISGGNFGRHAKGSAMSVAAGELRCGMRIALPGRARASPAFGEERSKGEEFYNRASVKWQMSSEMGVRWCDLIGFR